MHAVCGCLCSYYVSISMQLLVVKSSSHKCLGEKLLKCSHTFSILWAIIKIVYIEGAYSMMEVWATIDSGSPATFTSNSSALHLKNLTAGGEIKSSQSSEDLDSGTDHGLRLPHVTYRAGWFGCLAQVSGSVHCSSERFVFHGTLKYTNLLKLDLWDAATSCQKQVLYERKLVARRNKTIFRHKEGDGLLCMVK